MKTINVFETNEEVYIKATVRGVSVDNGVIKYSLRNNVTGLDEKYLYEESQIFPCPEEKKTPIVKTPAKKPVKKTTTKK